MGQCGSSSGLFFLVCRVGILQVGAPPSISALPASSCRGRCGDKRRWKETLFCLRLPCKPVRMCTRKLETNSPVVIWALKVWGIWTELKTPSPRHQLEMFSYFKDAGDGESHLGEFPLSLPLDGFATFLTGVGDPFLRLSAPLPRFQKSIVLSPQIRSRWSQAWPDWTLPIPEFGKSLVLGPQTSTT